MSNKGNLGTRTHGEPWRAFSPPSFAHFLPCLPDDHLFPSSPKLIYTEPWKKYYHLWKKVRFQSLFPLLLQVEASGIRRVSVTHSHVDARGCWALHNSKGSVLSTVLTFEEHFSVLQKLAGGGEQPTAMESQHCVRAEQASRISLLLSLKPWRQNILVHTRKQNTPALQSGSKCMQVRPIRSEHSLFQAAGLGRGDGRGIRQHLKQCVLLEPFWSEIHV